ncbi:phosphorylase family protein [Roseomonas elaeocarpi]|uniref:Hopanoid-associated phosphorylase n=1 Tax=Roseomonas elaeocarpi TaxID=907779 RepID=A0ABV6JR95_9PROT
MRREARLLRGAGVRVVTGGGDPAALEERLAPLAAEARGIISIGIAGALAPGLVPGDWVVGGAVLDGVERLPVDPDWSDALLESLPGAVPGLILGSDVIVGGPRQKAMLRRSSGAAAVDMESHVAARVARRYGLPFAAARVISDGAERGLPEAALVAMRPDGGVSLPAVFGSVIRDPLQIPALIRTGMEAGRAFRALLRGHRGLGPRLACPG